jgi:predicted metal-dependent TIM-barrel fold hydrolase
MSCNNEEGGIETRNVIPLDLDVIKGIRFFDPNIHMVLRTTDDYQAMADAGIVAVVEPAFWLGQPRTGLDSFRDYYSSLVGWERFSSSRFGIKHLAIYA